MARYLLNKLWQAALTLLLSALVVFIGVRLLPGDPALALAGEEADPATVAKVRADLGLDQPVLVQYLKFLGNLLHGDLGDSVRTGQPVTDLLKATRINKGFLGHETLLLIRIQEEREGFPGS